MAGYAEKIITAALLLLLSFNTSAAELIKDRDIVSFISSGNTQEFEKSIEYIRQNKPDTLPPLLKEKYINTNDVSSRERIISALKEFPVYKQSALWIEILKNTKDKKTETALIEFLSTSKEFSFTVPIAEKLIVPRSEVREKAALTLKKTGDDRMLPIILSLGQSNNPIDRIYFLEALNHIYDVRFQKLAISMLNDENKSVRIYAIKCVNNNEIKEALPPLRRLALKDDNNETRKMAIASLVSFKDTQSGSLLAGILKDESAEIRIEALKAIREFKYQQASDSISGMLLKEESAEVKENILDTLISFRKTGNINGLKYMIKNDPDPKMRVKAVYTIGVSGDYASSIETLKEALLDPDQRVRGESCNVMGSLKKGNVSDILINQIKTDSSRYVRSAALYSIEKINDSKNTVKLFDIYSVEDDRIFREMLRQIIRNSMQKHIR